MGNQLILLNNMNKMTRKNLNKKQQKMNQLVKLTGSGDYNTTLRKSKNTAMDIAKILGPTLKKVLIQGGKYAGGTAAGLLTENPAAIATGAKMGTLLGAKLSKLIGSGDYYGNDTRSNSLFGSKGDAYASFKTDGNRSIRIKHREFLQDIISPGTTFNLESYPINPGLPFSFPYLANIAQNFEEYRVRGLVFEYVATATPYSTTSNMGSVVMSMEYNTANPDYTSKSQMENSEYAISAPPYKNMVYGVECDRNAQNMYYVRTNTSVLPGPLTDLGNFFIATNSVQAGTIGELWVTYDIEFMRPRASTARFGFLSYLATGTGTTASLNSATILTSTGAFSSTASGTSALYFPDAIIGDRYMFTMSIQCAAGTAPTYPTLNAVGMALVTNGPLVNPAGAPVGNVGANSSAALTGVYFLDVTSQNPTLTITSATVPSGNWSFLLFCTDLGNSLSGSKTFGV